MEVETDQQVRAQAYAFPSHKHQDVVVPQNEREHGEHEQVEISEEAIVATFVRHVSSGINMDERAYAGDKQQPDGREWIQQEAGVSVKRGRCAVSFHVVHMAGIGTQPGINNFLEGLTRIVVSVSGVLPDGKAGKNKCQRHCAYTDRAHGSLLQLAAKEKHDGRAEGGEQRDEPDVVEEEHFLGSASSCWLLAFS